jgi:hypothetical protein
MVVFATSYDGFWVAILLFFALVLALPVGVVALIARKPIIATVCSVIWVGFGICAIVIGIQDESSDSVRGILFGIILTLVGLLFILFRRKAPERCKQTEASQQ